MAEFADDFIVLLLADGDALEVVEDLARGGEVDEGVGARQRPDEPADGLAHVDEDGLKGVPVGPGADRLAEALGVATEAAVGVGRLQAHGAGRHAVGELQQQVAAVDAVEGFEAAFEEVMPDLFGAVGGAVDAEDFGRRVGAEAEGAVLGAAVPLVEVGVFLHVPEAEVAEAHRQVGKQRARHVDGALRREHAEVGLEQLAFVGGGEDVGEGVIRGGDFRAEGQYDTGDHNHLNKAAVGREAT